MPTLAPGLQVNEFDLTEYATILGLTRVCCLGGASKGLIGVPTEITSPDELEEEFGPVLLDDDGLAGALKVLERGNNLVYVRVADTSPGTGAQTADQEVPGVTGAQVAVAATGSVQLDGSENPSAGETVVIGDGVGSAKATNTLTFTTATQPTAGDTVQIEDGAAVKADGDVSFAVIPQYGDVLVITNPATGTSESFEFTDGSGASSPTNNEVDISSTSDNGATELAASINSNMGTEVTATVTTISDPKITVECDIPGIIGNVIEMAPYYVGGVTFDAQPVLNGGTGGATVEFVASVDPLVTGLVQVLIGAAATNTNANLIAALAGIPNASLDMSYSDTSTVDPQTTLTFNQPGTAGNSGTLVVAGTTPPTVGGATFTGGLDGTPVTFEFIAIGGSPTPGNTGVEIQPNAELTMAEFIDVVNASALTITAADGTVTIPLCTLTNTTAGAAGNETITTTGANITVSGMSGGLDASGGTVSSAVMTLLAASPGTWGNGVKVVVTTPSSVFNADASSFDLTVYRLLEDGATYKVAERYVNLSLDSDDARYVETVLEEGIRAESVAASRYIRVDVWESTGKPTSGDYILGDGTGTTGSNGIATLTNNDYIGAVVGTQATGLRAVRNPEAVEFNVLIVPSRSSRTTIIDAMQEVVNYRGDCVGLIDPPFGLSNDEVVDWTNGLATLVPEAPTAPIDSNRMGILWSWVKDYDEVNQVNRWYPPSACYAAQMAENDNVNGPTHPTAGFVVGKVEGDEVEYSPDAEDREVLMSGQNRVNAIVDYVNEGLVIFGNLTMQRSDTWLKWMHVRRGLLHAEKLCATAVKYLLWDPNDPITWQKLEDLCNPILAGIAADRGLDYFAVQCDASTNPLAKRTQGVMNGKLFLRPVLAAEVIELDFVLTQSGATFNEG